MLETWTLAVLGLMNSSSAICRLLRPAATRLSTSRSRSVSPKDALVARRRGTEVDPEPSRQRVDLLAQQTRTDQIGERGRLTDQRGGVGAVAAGAASSAPRSSACPCGNGSSILP